MAYIDSIHAELRKARDLAARNIEEAQEKYKAQHDKRAVPPEFSVRNKVWLRTKKKKIGLSFKLCETIFVVSGPETDERDFLKKKVVFLVHLLYVHNCLLG